jgi:hypothetical protein
MMIVPQAKRHPVLANGMISHEKTSETQTKPKQNQATHSSQLELKPTKSS